MLSIRPREQVIEVSGPLPAEAATAMAAVDASRQGLELLQRTDGKTWVLVRRERRLIVEVTPGTERDPELLEVTGLLNLVPGLSNYGLVVAPGRIVDPLLYPAPPSDEMRVTARSTAQVYQFLARGVQVPPEHVAAGLIGQKFDTGGTPGVGDCLRSASQPGTNLRPMPTWR